MHMNNLNAIDLKDKTALLRLNLNVPIKNGKILDEFRLQVILPTIDYCHTRAKKVVIMAHLGRPEGEDPKFSLKPVADRLSVLLKEKIVFLNDCIGQDVRNQIQQAPDQSIILLENVRFHKGEVENNEEFGKELAQNGDIFINDAFGDNAKATASIIWPPQILPSAAGFRLQEELEQLRKLKENPEHPFIVLIGGAKIKEKMGVIKELGKKAERILIGGGVANTLLKAKGFDVKASLVQQDELELAKHLLQEFGSKIVLPLDGAVAKKTDAGFDKESFRYVPIGDLADNEAILDLGIQTYDLFQDHLSRAQTIFWAGPLGYIEWEKTAHFSIQVAELLAGYANHTAAGGGETISLLTKAKVLDQIDFCSTGGSASLKYLSGKTLPGVDILN